MDLVSEQGTPPEKRLENEGAFRAAPDLYETIRAVRENANRDERARDRRMLERLAGTVLEMLPDEQIEQLKEEAAYVARLE